MSKSTYFPATALLVAALIVATLQYAACTTGGTAPTDPTGGGDTGPGPFTIGPGGWSLAAGTVTPSSLLGVAWTGPGSFVAVGEAGHVAFYDNGKWRMYDLVVDLTGVWAGSADNVIAVGAHGAVKQWDGESWRSPVTGTNEDLRSVWGIGESGGFAVGNNGTILRFDGDAWSSMSSGTSTDLLSVWARNASEAWAVGYGGTIVHFDGQSWGEQGAGTNVNLYAVYGFGSRAYIVGATGVHKWYKRGLGWVDESTSSPYIFTSLCGTGSSDQYATGRVSQSTEDRLLHYDGNDWNLLASVDARLFSATAGGAGPEVYAVGEYGLVLAADGPAVQPINRIGTSETLGDVYVAAPNEIIAAGEMTPKRWTGSSWEPFPGAPSVQTRWTAIWGSGPSDMVVVGSSNHAMRFDGNTWEVDQLPSNGSDLTDVYGVGDVVFAVGENGMVYRHDGTSWAEIDAGAGTANLNGVWAASTDDVFVVGDGGIIVHFDGSAWSEMQAYGDDVTLYSVSGASGDNVYAVGRSGSVRRYDGAAWFAVTTGAGQTRTLRRIEYIGDGQFLACGDSGTILHFDGSEWHVMQTETLVEILGISGVGGKNMIAVGREGTTLTFTDDSAPVVTR